MVELTRMVVPATVVDKLLIHAPSRSTAPEVLVALYALLQHRHCAQERIAVGAEVYDFADPTLDLAALLHKPRDPTDPVSTPIVARAGEDWVMTARPGADLFAPDIAAAMHGRFANLVTAVSEEPAAPLADIRFWSDIEAMPPPNRWRDTPYRPGTVIAAIEEQVARTPDAVAVESGDERLTYAELDRRAGALAEILADRAESPFVGVHMDRSTDLLITLLSVLKAGFAYVPIDPSTPGARVRHTVENAGLDLVLCAPEHVVALAALGVPAVTLAQLSAGRPNGRLRPPGPDSPIYMIYTSGSTGEPKGVVNRHTGVLNTIRWRQSALPMTADDVVLQKTPITFDVSVWELFWPLLVGARVVMAAPGGHRDTRYLRRTIRDRRVTVLHFVPSMLDAFLDEPGLAADCATVRRVLCSGEALSTATANRFHRLIKAELHNLYGPTEAAIDVSHWACVPGHTGVVPIGREGVGTSLHVVDGSMRPLPPGVVGELCVGGVQVALGYHGLAALTAERFVPDPFADGTRMYRTGDLARRRPDGELEYLGRVDDQVKVRGFRVEPGEVEHALRAVDGVTAAAVVARDGAAGKELVAFVVGRAPDGVRELLADVLPGHMVPAFVLPAAELPVSANGKLDRRALTDAASSLPTPATSGLGPRTPIEATLCELFAAALGVDTVGIDDDFFAAGGHSLAAVKLANRVNAVLGADIDVWILFECPTVAELAVELQGG